MLWYREEVRTVGPGIPMDKSRAAAQQLAHSWQGEGAPCWFFCGATPVQVRFQPEGEPFQDIVRRYLQQWGVG